MAYTVTALLLFLRTTVIAWFFMISGIKFTTVTRISGRQNQVVDLKDLQTKADRCFNNFIDDPSQPKDLFIDYFDTLSAILSNVLNNGDNPYSKDSLIDDKYTALLMDVADRMVERIVDGKHYHSRFYDVLEISHYLVDDVTKYIKKGHYKIKDSLFCLWKLKFSASIVLVSFGISQMLVKKVVKGVLNYDDNARVPPEYVKLLVKINTLASKISGVVSFDQLKSFHSVIQQSGDCYFPDEITVVVCNIRFQLRIALYTIYASLHQGRNSSIIGTIAHLFKGKTKPRYKSAIDLIDFIEKFDNPHWYNLLESLWRNYSEHEYKLV